MTLKQKNRSPEAMKINEQILKAIERAVEESGNAYQLSLKLGISHSTVLFWLSGKTRNINGDIWFNRLEPILRKHLREIAPDVKYPVASISLAEDHIPYKAQNEVTALPHMNEAPVISFAQAAGFDPALEPFDEFAKGCSSETAIFANEVKGGYFALRVEGDSMSPEFPQGTVILVAGGEFPQRGDTVVAKIRSTGQVIVKQYSRKDNLIHLDSINPDGQNFEWNCKENPGYLDWMYPVIEANINLRKQRWARHNSI